jgi:hypothetical protein
VWDNLTSQVEDLFYVLEGVGLPTINMGHGIAKTAFGFGVWDPYKEAEHNREYMKTYAKSPAGKASVAKRDAKRVANAKPKKVSPRKDAANRKIKRLSAKILEWQAEAKRIVEGRDYNSSQWVEVMLDPHAPDAIEARTDFAYFLRHKGLRLWQIASMLKVTKDEVAEWLSKRNV